MGTRSLRDDRAGEGDIETDLLVFGSGAGGLSATLFGARAGLDVLLCEKRTHVGGTTATSGGGIWVPGTQAGLAAGDSIERATAYLRGELGSHYRADLVETYLAQGARVIESLNAQTEVRYELSAWPDYHSDAPGGVRKGRTLFPAPFDGRLLGPDFALVQPPMHRLMVLGGLMLGANEIEDFLHPLASAATAGRVARKVARYARDRLRHGRGTDLRFGNALVARMLYSMPRERVSIWTEAPLVELLRDGERICGAVVLHRGTARRVRARRGVVLATGGFPHNQEMLRTYGPAFPHRHSLGCPANVGEGIRAAQAVGAAMDTALASVANWTPASVVRDRQGRETPVIYGYLDRGRPGVIAVNAQGRRFVNESNSYNDIVSAMFRDGGGREAAFHFVCDHAFVRRHGLGLVRPWPWTRSLAPYARSGYITVADSLPELARRIGVDAASLVQTVERHNGYCRTGVDLEFGKGSTAYNRMFGHPSAAPNPNLAPIEAAPFVALRIHAASIGTTIGLKTTADAQVVGTGGDPIPGLYACGNDLAAIMRGGYPGGGTMIGPAIVFGCLAVEHMLQARAATRQAAQPRVAQPA
ncbi:FAD-binding protein [Pseudorhodoferax sp.]|uniref:FAD-binding protein n=1 Tax=Pseudorhodoferax sp. TaxID=1993553 RepID=UPI0039E63E09